MLKNKKLDNFHLWWLRYLPHIIAEFLVEIDPFHITEQTLYKKKQCQSDKFKGEKYVLKYCSRTWHAQTKRKERML